MPIDIPVAWNDIEAEKIVDEAIAQKKTKLKRYYMNLSVYNGFDGKVRDIADLKIRVARELRLIPEPRSCCICGKSEGKLDYHAEDYSRPLKVAPICKSCHTALHRRTDSAGWSVRWAKLMQDYGDGSKWFESLTAK